MLRYMYFASLVYLTKAIDSTVWV